MNNEKYVITPGTCKECGEHKDVNCEKVCESCWGKIEQPRAPTASDAGTIDTREFHELTKAYYNSGGGADHMPRLRDLVAHIDQHVAAAVEQAGWKVEMAAEDRITNLIASLQDAEADLAKLRSTAGVGELIEAARKETRDYYEAKIADLFAATAPVSAAPAAGFDECVASGFACDYGPYGFDREQQCRYCGKAEPRTMLPPSASAPVSGAEGKTPEIEGIADGQELPAPTSKQIEEYINAADDELGPTCCAPWVDACRVALRSLAMRQPQGDDKADAERWRHVRSEAFAWLSMRAYGDDFAGKRLCGLGSFYVPDNIPGQRPRSEADIDRIADAALAAKQAGKEGA